MDYQESDLTPWFDGKRHKPARPGVYMLRCGRGTFVGFQKWHGTAWSPWADSAETAARYTPNNVASPPHQHDNWRGLREEVTA